MEQFVSTVLILRANFKALNKMNCLSGFSLLPSLSYSFSELMMSLLFSVLDIIYTTVYFMSAQTWRHSFSVLHSLVFTSHVFASTDGNNEVTVLWPWFSQPAHSQFGCDVGKLSCMFERAWPLQILGQAALTLCRLQNYSLLTKVVAFMVNSGIKMDREVKRHLWEGQRYLPSQFLLPVSVTWWIIHLNHALSQTHCLCSVLIHADPLV